MFLQGQTIQGTNIRLIRNDCLKFLKTTVYNLEEYKILDLITSSGLGSSNSPPISSREKIHRFHRPSCSTMALEYERPVESSDAMETSSLRVRLRAEV